MFLIGWMVSCLVYAVSFSEKSGQVMLDLVIAVGTLSTSQINNDRGSLIAIYDPQSLWETYFKP